jgi:hypothetical protein
MYFKLCLGSSGGTDLSRRMYSGSITVYSVWGVIVIGSIIQNLVSRINTFPSMVNIGSFLITPARWGTDTEES